MICEDVNSLTLDAFRFPRDDAVPEPIILKEVLQVRRP